MENVSARCFSYFFFFRERLFKILQNPRVYFFRSRKRLWRIKNVFFFFFIYHSWFFSLMQCLQLPFIIRVEEAVSWTQRFFFFLWQTKLKENVWRNFKFQENRTNAIGKRRLNSSNRDAMSTLYGKNDTTDLSGYKLGELTGNKKKNKKLYFSSQVRKQFKILTVPFEPLRPCSVKWYSCE